MLKGSRAFAWRVCQVLSCDAQEEQSFALESLPVPFLLRYEHSGAPFQDVSRKGIALAWAEPLLGEDALRMSWSSLQSVCKQN